MRVQFKPVTLCREMMVEDPSARAYQTLAKRAKNAVMSEDAMERRKYAESLPVQGQLMRVHSFASDIWATTVGGLGSEVLKFALNAATDTLPHNSNQEQCKLCGKKQTLLHVLNNCEVTLKLRRYIPGMTRSGVLFRNWPNFICLLSTTFWQNVGKTNTIFLLMLFQSLCVLT